MKQRGYSMVELLISLTLGLMLTLGVIKIYTGSKQTYRTQDGMGRLQENARLALDIIAHDLRMIGYAGCNGLGEVAVTDSGVTFAYTEDTAVAGNQSTGADGATVSGSLPPNLSAAWRIPHTDVLTIKSAGQCSQLISSSMADAASAIAIPAGNSCGFAANEIVMIANCSNADVFRISADPNLSDTLTHTGLSQAYLASGETEVMRVASNTYYIGTETTYGLPALFVINNTALTPTPATIVDGVENMQVQYGIDTDDDDVPNRFVNADEVTDWAQPVAVRVTLLMRTIENMQAQAMNFNVGGSDANYAAGPIRQKFSTTVKLRNRVLQREDSSASSGS